MSTLATVRSEIATALAADSRLSSVNVSTHGGDFGLADLRRYAKASPALVLALLNYRAGLEGGSYMVTAVWGLVAIVGTTPADDADNDLRGARDSAVIALADRATRALLGYFYGASAPKASAPRNFEAHNQYDPELDKEGIAMYAMTWEQVVELEDTPLDDFEDLISVHADWETHTRDGETLGEVPEAEDIIDNLDA